MCHRQKNEQEKCSSERYAAVRAGLRGQATFARQDLWKSDMSKYDNVVIFGVEQMMEQLEEKLEKELKEGSTVVACRFLFCKSQNNILLQVSVSFLEACWRSRRGSRYCLAISEVQLKYLKLDRINHWLVKSNDC